MASRQGFLQNMIKINIMRCRRMGLYVQSPAVTVGVRTMDMEF